MMTFEDRERAFEAKYAHDEAFRFRLAARRDKLFAQAVATELALSEEEAGALTHDVLAIADLPDHDTRLLALVRQIMTARGHPHTVPELSQSLREAGERARLELIEGSAASL